MLAQPNEYDQFNYSSHVQQKMIFFFFLLSKLSFLKFIFTHILSHWISMKYNYRRVSETNCYNETYNSYYLYLKISNKMNTKVFIKSVEFRNILKTSVDRENQLHFDDNFWWLYLLSELKRLKSVHYSYMYTVMTDIHVTMTY